MSEAPYLVEWTKLALERVLGKRNGLSSRDDDVLGSRSEGAIALRSVAPNALTYP